MEAIPVITASVGILFLPGLVVAYLIGLRGLWAAALSPLVSTTLLVVAAVITPVLRLPWSILSAVSIAMIIGFLVVVLLRGVLRTRFSLPDRSGGTVVTAWALAAVPTALIILISIGNPGSISQTYDSIFHLNLVEFILDEANASPLVAGRLVSPDASTAFYPNAWNLIVSLVVGSTGASIPVAANALNLVLAVAVWPIGLLLLIRQLIGDSRLHMYAGALLCTGLTAFPLNLLYYGVLYPFFFGLLFLAPVLALLVQILRVGHEARITKVLGLCVLLLGVLPGMLIAHPGAFMAALALSVPLVLVSAGSNFRQLPKEKKLQRLLGVAVYFAAGLLMLLRLRPSYTWPPRISTLEAAGRVFTLALQGYGLPIVAAALAIIGLVVALRRRGPADLAVVGIWIVGALTFFVAAGIPFWRLRQFTVGVWYADTPRLAAVYAIALLPAAVLGATWLGKWLLYKSRFSVKLTGSFLVVLCGVGIHLTAGWTEFVPVVNKSYSADSDSKLLTADEITILEMLPELVPENSTIAGNPWTGTALAYALGQRDVLMSHVQSKLNSDGEKIVQELRWADERPDVCGALNREGVGYVLDFGDREVHGGNHRFPGLEELASSPAVDLVAVEGEAKLYRLVACE
ncbi:DUF6541 family protein [Leucobacter denitrificans]|uniref:Uncharacterized protein n=1 Tax=Leucobacter denitrificans TaxID=683042 RepID=A0A7G9S3K0_9MICO|nr:DUF6541 family protein [Leucobacter denitrificans]QNN62425.1 hypothetical protein H9L06_09175 [Leucobacter denitrificans]